LVVPSIQQIGCKWVLKNKYNVDGSFQHHRAKLVVKCFHQHAGINHCETISLVVKPTTVHVILTLALSGN